MTAGDCLRVGPVSHPWPLRPPAARFKLLHQHSGGSPCALPILFSFWAISVVYRSGRLASTMRACLIFLILGYSFGNLLQAQSTIASEICP
jgi:hypothetical protein